MDRDPKGRSVPERPERDDPWQKFTYSRHRNPLGPILLIIVIVAALSVALSHFIPQLQGLFSKAENLPIVESLMAEDKTPETRLPRSEADTGLVLSFEPTPAEPLSPSDIYRQCIPSVVSVTSLIDDQAYGGTGIIVSGDGYLVTNYHIIEGASRAIVSLQDDTPYEASLVGLDVNHDLAVLKIDAEGLTPAVFGDSDNLSVGDSVFAIGDPSTERLRGTMTDGIVSSLKREIWVDGRYMTLLQTTAALNPGNSGGPLINEYGQVVGISAAKINGNSSPISVEALCFAIPSHAALPLINEILATGTTAGRPVFGITARAVSAGEADFYEVPAGLYIYTVDDRSGSWEGGLRPGDIVTAINGVLPENMDIVDDILDESAVGDTLHLTVLRDGTTLELDITLVNEHVLDESPQ